MLTTALIEQPYRVGRPLRADSARRARAGVLDDGGPTDLDNGCLLCPSHHRLVHRENWAARLAGNGYPEFIPPASYDPHRRPRQHPRYRM